MTTSTPPGAQHPDVPGWRESRPDGGAPRGGPLAALGRAATAVDEAAATMWAARSGAELVATVEAVAHLRAKLDGLELAVAAELEVSPAGQQALKDDGWASARDFLTHAAGGRRRSGPATARLARRVQGLPSVAEALADGWLSRTQARIVAEAIERLPQDVSLRDRAVALMLDEATRLCADDLETVGHRLVETLDPTGDTARRERELERTERSAHLNRSLRIGFDGLGGGAGRFNGSKEDLLLVSTVLLSLAAPQPAEPGSCGGDGVCADLQCRTLGHSGRDLRDHGARMFDALVQLARTAQSSGALPQGHGGVPQVVVTMDHDDLRDAVGRATTTAGVDLDPATARRLACDADLVPAVLGGDGSVLDVGRSQRLVTAAIWLALVVRDQHCAFPGCRRPPVMCHAHHVVHWADGGPTSLANLVLLCGTHHRIVHSTPWRVRISTSDARPEFLVPGSTTWVRERGCDPPGERERRPAA
ncbi:DUF222 domain-containing protein [Nocardioides sp. HDW12B]|uniref:HNH endonuclease signature motif containing protein n=1 Tax=Nocardioides sp. HDW12B TaxID=2714939 RepID=UPI00140DAB5A|nr:HNH endonuclease signature motif containing protein [Nocardioides sp. HDW12B]QIK66603.1 DUF222 domain-containing protein [Nocardioides sp. HDW12B]